MKLVAGFFCLFVAVAIADDDFESIVKKAMGYAMMCAQTVMPNGDDYQNFMSLQNLDNPKVSCLLSCVMKKFRVIRRYVINVEKMAEIFNTYPDLTMSKDQVIELVTDCKIEAEATPKNCSMPGVFAECCKKRIMSIYSTKD